MGAEVGKKLTAHLRKLYFLSQVPDETSPSLCLLEINQPSYFTTQNLYKIVTAYAEISAINQEKYRKYQVFFNYWNKEKVNKQHYISNINISINRQFNK